MKIRWVLGSLVLLTGCAVGPNYKRPEVSLPSQVRGAPETEVANAASLADRPWWEIFPDDTLKSLIDEALRNNYDVRTAAWHVEEFRARAGIARSELYPQVDFEGGWSRARQSEFVAPPGPTTASLQSIRLGLSWEIDLWGRVRRLSEAALAQYLSTEEARRGVLLSVTSETAQAYFGLLELDERLAIARRTTEAFQGTYELFDHQLAGGFASQLEVSRAEAALEAASATIPDLERQIVAQENLISFLLGRPPGPIPRGESLMAQTLPSSAPPGLPSTLLDRRPDVRQAEQELVAANANVGAAKAAFYPTINLTDAIGGVSPDLSNIVHAGKIWAVAARLSWPVFTGGRLRNQYEAQKALFEQSLTQYEATVTNAFGEVSTALAAHQKLAGGEAEQARSVAAYQDAVRLANIRYRAGLSSYVEVLDAQQQLFPAENVLASTRLARLDALVSLYKSLGGGWPVQPRQIASLTTAVSAQP